MPDGIKIKDLVEKATGVATDEFVINDAESDKKLGMDGIRITKSQVTDTPWLAADITLASTDLTNTANIALLDAANAFTGANTFAATQDLLGNTLDNVGKLNDNGTHFNEDGVINLANNTALSWTDVGGAAVATMTFNTTDDFIYNVAGNDTLKITNDRLIVNRDSASTGILNMVSEAKLNGAPVGQFEAIGHNASDVDQVYGRQLVVVRGASSNSGSYRTDVIQAGTLTSYFECHGGGQNNRSLKNLSMQNNTITDIAQANLNAAGKLTFDGGGNTSIRGEVAGDDIIFETAGVDQWTILSGGDLEHTRGTDVATSGVVRFGGGDLIHFDNDTDQMELSVNSKTMSFGLTGTQPAAGGDTTIEFFDANTIFQVNLLIETGNGTSLNYLSQPAGGTLGSTASAFITELGATDDTGSRAVTEFVSRRSTPAVIATRPLFEWLNHTTLVTAVSAAGDWDFQGNDITGVATATISTLIDTPDIETGTVSARDGSLAITIANTTGVSTFVSGAVLVAPVLGTPASGVLSNCTGYPVPPEHVTILADSVSVVWSNQPAALTEFKGNTDCRVKVDATNHTQCRLVVNVITAGFAGATVHPEYDAGSGFLELADTANAMDTAIDATGLIDSGFVNIDALSKADVTIRIVGEGGNAMVDPDFTMIHLEFK